MTKTFVIADTHFGHAGVCRFLREDGTKLRPWDNPDDMDKALVENWNSVVSDKDRVYLLGDVAINRQAMFKVLPLLKGRLCLIKGNHDIFKLQDYVKYFDDIRAYVVHKFEDKKVIMSHIPIHPESLGRFGVNIHGHLHSNNVPIINKEFIEIGVKTYDPKYINVSVEQINYTPVEVQTILNEKLK